MVSILRQLTRVIPTLILSFALALAVWISSVTAAVECKAAFIPDCATGGHRAGPISYFRQASSLHKLQLRSVRRVRYGID